MKIMQQRTGQMCLIFAGLAGSVTSCQHPEPSKPNIILFMVDDMGWEDSSVPFWTSTTPANERYHTPALENLARQGMKFTQAYACAVCSPSRVSLLTGMNAARHRVTNWTLVRNRSEDQDDSVLVFPPWNINGVQPTDTVPRSAFATMLPHLLHENGYYTIHCGKAHWGATHTAAANPLNLGFDVNIAGHAAGGLASYFGEDNFGNKAKGGFSPPWGVPGLEKYHGDSIFLTEALTREAISALDKARKTNKPFFLNMAHYAVHIPLMADKRFIGRYSNLPQPEANYASMIEGMDKSLGGLMDYLEKNRLTGNTIILFMSDNGGFSLKPREGNPPQTNYPLNSGKGSAYEGGIRVPMIVKWPGKVQSNSVCNDYLTIEDFFPTILEMAGVKSYETVQQVDGMSFLPMLFQTGTTAKDRDLFWHFPNKWGGKGPGIGTTSTIRNGDWKLIYYYKDSRVELFNLKDDIGELHNVAPDYPDTVVLLRKKLGDYLRRVDAQRPVYRATGAPVPWPDEAGCI